MDPSAYPYIFFKLALFGLMVYAWRRSVAELKASRERKAADELPALPDTIEAALRTKAPRAKARELEPVE